EDRVENLSAAGQAREETVEAAFAVKSDGTILGIDVKVTMDHGAYPVIPLATRPYVDLIRVMLPSYLRTRNYRYSATTAVTNKAPYVSYRGPWAVETLVRELMIGKIARALGLLPEDVYRKNAVTLEEQPVRMVTGATLEGMTARTALERALELVDVDAFRAEPQLSRTPTTYH